MMAGLEKLLLDAGGKILSRMAAKQFGPEVGAIAGDALGMLAEALGVEADPVKVEEAAAKLPAPELGRVVAEVEGRTAEMILAQAKLQDAANESQRLTNERLNAPVTSGNRWLVVWQYLLMLFWGFVVLLAPVGNAVIRLTVCKGACKAGFDAPQIDVLDVGTLLTLTGLYLTLHMGGHTLLEMVREQWGGLFGRLGKKAG